MKNHESHVDNNSDVFVLIGLIDTTNESWVFPASSP